MNGNSHDSAATRPANDFGKGRAPAPAGSADRGTGCDHPDADGADRGKLAAPLQHREAARRSQAAFARERDAAIAALRRAQGVASDETGVRIEGSNLYQWVFHSSEAVVHRAAGTRGAVVVRDLMDGHRLQVGCSDRYSAQQGHGEAHQISCPGPWSEVLPAFSLRRLNANWRATLDEVSART